MLPNFCDTPDTCPHHMTQSNQMVTKIPRVSRI